MSNSGAKEFLYSFNPNHVVRTTFSTRPKESSVTKKKGLFRKQGAKAEREPLFRHTFYIYFVNGDCVKSHMDTKNEAFPKEMQDVMDEFHQYCFGDEVPLGIWEEREKESSE